MTCFEFKGQPYLLVINYFSHYVKEAKLSHTTSPDIEVHHRSMYARHSIPDQLISDNGPQFSANTFAKFAEEYRITHIVTSPRYPHANGEVSKNSTKESTGPTQGIDDMPCHTPPEQIKPSRTADGKKNPYKSPYAAYTSEPKLALLKAISQERCFTESQIEERLRQASLR